MIKFRRGDTLDVELVFANKVEIKDLHIYFVHEEDENEHIYWGLQRKGGATEPIPPASETRLRWDKHIEEGKKLGVYVLDTMNFLSSDDTLIEVADSLEDWKFEVVSAGESVPDIVETLPTVNDPTNDLIVVKQFSLSPTLPNRPLARTIITPALGADSYRRCATASRAPFKPARSSRWYGSLSPACSKSPSTSSAVSKG